MNTDHHEVLNPEGDAEARSVPRPPGGAGLHRDPVIALIDNSKPNVAYFLDGIEKAIRGLAVPYETLRVRKPRSAGPLPELDQLAKRCDYVINAVAD